MVSATLSTILGQQIIYALQPIKANSSLDLLSRLKYNFQANLRVTEFNVTIFSFKLLIDYLNVKYSYSLS